MNIEKSQLDYGRLQPWQKSLLQQCAQAMPQGTQVVEISSDYPKYSGYFKLDSGETKRRVTQIVRGSAFVKRGDNLNGARLDQDSLAVTLPRQLGDDGEVGLFILDCSLFLSELVDEYNAWCAHFRKGCRVLLPLQEYGIYRDEKMLSLPAAVMRGALQASGLLMPQQMGNLFTALCVTPAAALQPAQVRDSAIAYFERIAALRDGHGETLLQGLAAIRNFEFSTPQMQERLARNEASTGIDILGFCYLIEHFLATQRPQFLHFSRQLLEAKHYAARSHYALDMPTWTQLLADFAGTVAPCSVDGLIERLRSSEDLAAISTLLLQEQLRLILLQEVANPLYYMLLGSVEL